MLRNVPTPKVNQLHVVIGLRSKEVEFSKQREGKRHLLTDICPPRGLSLYMVEE
jgi:hypothetical protein